MGKIFFSMSGEGRGHATRVRSTVEALRGRHDIVLFCPGDAYELLSPVYRGTEVRVCKIPCLRFFYYPDGTLNKFATARMGIRYLRHFKRIVRKLEKTIRREKPDVVITDFEPALSRAAKNCSVPFISVNHQHFLLANDLSELPFKLRFHAFLMSLVVRQYYCGQVETVISQFYFPPVKKSCCGEVQMAGVLMRPDLLKAEPRDGDFLLAYLRKFASHELLDVLRNAPHPVKVYGLGERVPEGQITYCPINDATFLEDLSSCKALITTAGNQLVGEALYLNKPVLGMPEAGNHEQYINAFYLEKSGAGRWCELNALTPKVLQEFLDDIPKFKTAIDSEKMNGNPIVVETIERWANRNH